MKDRKPAVAKVTSSDSIKALWHRAKKKEGFNGSLKEFAKSSNLEEAQNWLFNKKANFSMPPLGLGSTRRKLSKEKSNKNKDNTTSTVVKKK